MFMTDNSDYQIEEHSGSFDPPILFGRLQELALFREMVAAKTRGRIINVYGTAGIGKSCLLQAFQSQSGPLGFLSLCIEGHSSLQTPAAFCTHLVQLISPDERAPLNQGEDIVAVCMDQLYSLSEKQQIVLFLDAYEGMDSIDRWLREHFLIRLHKRIVTVIAGKLPLSEAWYLSLDWRKLLVPMPLTELPFTALRQFCHTNGIHSETSIVRLWNETKGHPLLMAVAAMTQPASVEEPAADGVVRVNGIDFLSYIVERWLNEVSGPKHRTIVEAASALRYFNQEVLSHVLECDIDTEDFRELIRYSFVQKTNHGWKVHDLLRNAVVQDLNMRSPKKYEQYLTRIVSFYYEHFAMGRRDNETFWVAGELMYFIGGPIPRAFMQGLSSAPRYFKHASRTDYEEINQYLIKRNEQSRETVINLFDPYTNRNFQFTQTVEQNR
jgi:hypothetical protein